MNQSQGPSWFRRTLNEQPALLVSLLYLFASVIGLFYSWAFLRPFGINMLQYAEVSDFLLASIKEPLTWGLVLVSVLSIQLDNALSRRAQRRNKRGMFRWYGSDRYRQLNYPVFVLLVGAFLFAYADIKERQVRSGGVDRYEIQLADDSEPAQRILLGTTVNFIFLYDPESERVSIHPNESVLALSKPIPGSPVTAPDVAANSPAPVPGPEEDSTDTRAPEPPPETPERGAEGGPGQAPAAVEDEPV